MLNGATSLLPLLTVNENNSLYYNISIVVFCMIATVNHLFPENLAGTTHIVKMLVSNILFSLMNFPAPFGVIISISDLSPILSHDKHFKYFGEKFLQIPRQIIEAFLLYRIFQTHAIDCILMVAFKIIYFIERRNRIKKNNRNDFSILHSAEHFGLYFLFKDLTNTTFDITKYLTFFTIYLCLVAILVYVANIFFSWNFEKRTPDWVREHEGLTVVLREKVAKNRGSKKIYNYFLKFWAWNLKFEFVSWRKLEKYCESLVKIINPDEYDIIIGICTGGGFVGAYTAKLMNKPFQLIKSKLWSEKSFYQNVSQLTNYFLGRDFAPKLSEMPNVKDLRVLLIDDTTCTGVTFNNVMKALLDIGQARSVKTCCIRIKGVFTPDIYLEDKRVPIFWEWGVEVD